MAEDTKKPMKLTLPQEAMLRRVVATNGGGVHAGFNETGNETKVIRRLESLGLVQGKAGNLARAVHTREGLAWVRDSDKTKETK